jgi:hypothetical protein
LKHLPSERGFSRLSDVVSAKEMPLTNRSSHAERASVHPNSGLSGNAT